MSRVELYHSKTKPYHWKVPFLFLFILSIILAVGFLVFQHLDQSTMKTDNTEENPGKKVFVALPNGHEVYTYEKYIVKKGSKTYYKGERNTIDLTGGKVEYKDW